MACPRVDFHIHTKYLGCANATMEVPAIVRECERIGVTALGITDHVNRLEQVPLHRAILEDLRAVDTDIDLYFGVELNYTGCDEGFPFSDEIREEYGFQFAIGGIHSTYLEERDLRKVVDIQHAHHLKTCRDPLVQVLVHPYWFPHGEAKIHGWPALDWMRNVPESYARELGQAAKETNTAIEVNAMANLAAPARLEGFVDQYAEYLAILAEEGATFAVGSDAHDIGHLKRVSLAWNVVETLQLPPERVWRPDARPLNRRT